MPDLALGHNHASAVAFHTQAVVFTGKSGSGKSRAVVDALALGAALISDDVVEVTTEQGKLLANAPQPQKAAVEVRNVGILGCKNITKSAPIGLVIDLEAQETQRLPEPRSLNIEGLEVDSIAGGHISNVAAVAKLWIEGGGRLKHAG